MVDETAAPPHPDPLMRRYLELDAAARFRFETRAWSENSPAPIADVILRSMMMQPMRASLAQAIAQSIESSRDALMHEIGELGGDVAVAVLACLGQPPPSPMHNAVSTAVRRRHAPEGALRDVALLLCTYESIAYAPHAEAAARREVLLWSGPTPWRTASAPPA